MKVFIANFGRENYEWPECLKRHTIATMNAEAAQLFWESGDREAYINHCLENIKTAAGILPTRSVASRWYNLMTTIAQSSGDLWIHREKEQLWWTTSTEDTPHFEPRVEPVN